MALKSFTPDTLRRRVFGQLWSLALQFVLGMLLNFIGSDATGTKHVISNVILALHVLNGIGLIEGGIYIALKERSGLAWRAAWAMVVAFGAGIMTMITKQDAWSFVMSVGFIGGAWLYVMRHVRADRTLRPSKEKIA